MTINTLTRLGALALTCVALLLSGRRAEAQTAEGTVIRNIATVSFTDANGNSYTPQADTADVTVGFAPGLNVSTTTVSVTPASPSTADTLLFRLHNLGNGTDSVSVAEALSVSGIISVTGYRVGTTTYASLATLNTALSGMAIAAGDSLTIKVVYDVVTGKGGESTVYTLTGTSRRSGSTSASRTATIAPPLDASVATSPKGGQNLTRLPSNGTNYTFTFTVTNNGAGSDGFDLLASRAGSAITIVSVDGVVGDSARITGVAAGASRSVDVVYSIGNVAAGTVDTLRLVARSTGDTGASDQGFADVTVIRAAVTISKQVFRDDQSTAIGGSDRVLPGEYIQYRITVTNGGAAPAASVQVSDVIATQLTYASSAGDAIGWTLAESGGTVTATLAGTLAPAASRYFWIRVQVK